MGKKMQEEKTLSRRQFLTTFRTPMTQSPACFLARLQVAGLEQYLAGLNVHGEEPGPY
ncbi:MULTISPECIES: hypothetical protein [unclassified Caballeronia]|uniref:hypothetical protein n=1 Tax=unclassified Caballeronia TaxID=2646786 RepID=UPI0013EB7A7A|nr:MULTISPECIES: hypothetical protein [unclassified Caballeronia]